MKFQKSLTYLIALTIALPALSQEEEGRNMAKINLSAFAFKGINMQYERQVARGITVALGYSKVPTSTIPYRSFIEKRIEDPNVAVSDFRIGTSIFTPEVRFYFSERGAFHGFYVAPYGRIGTYNITGPVNFTSTFSGTKTAMFDGKFHTLTGGVLLGSNFQLSSRLYLDWWILGASVGSANGNLNADLSLSPDEQRALQDVLNDIDVPFTRIETSVKNNGATVKTTGTMLGARGLGVSLGFRF